MNNKPPLHPNKKPPNWLDVPNARPTFFKASQVMVAPLPLLSPAGIRLKMKALEIESDKKEDRPKVS